MLPWFLVWYIHVHWILLTVQLTVNAQPLFTFSQESRSHVLGDAGFVNPDWSWSYSIHSLTGHYTCIYPRLSCFERLFPSISISDLENALTIVRIWWKTERKLCPTILSYSRCKYFFVPDSLLISIHFIIHVYIYVDYGFNKHRIPLLLDQIVLIKKPMDLTKLQIGIRVQSFSAIFITYINNTNKSINIDSNRTQLVDKLYLHTGQ